MTDLSNDGPFGFEWDIAYALSRENLSRGKRKLDLTDCRVIATRILEHLRLSNVELTRAPVTTPPRYPISKSD